MPRDPTRLPVSLSDTELNLMEELRGPSGWSTELSASGEPAEASRGGSEVSSSLGQTEGPDSPGSLSGPATVQVRVQPLMRRAWRGLARWSGTVKSNRQQLPAFQAPGEAQQAAPEVRAMHNTGGSAATAIGDGDDRMLTPSMSEDDGARTGDPEDGPRCECTLRAICALLSKHWYRLLIVSAILTALILTAVKGVSVFGDILDWFQARNNFVGWSIFTVMYTATVALFLPGVAFIMGAGLVFGFWRAFLAVWIGGAIGQALAFLLARYLLRDWVEGFIHGKWRMWEYINRAIEHEGWKLVLIIRLSPVIPYNLLNIAMATTSMPFWQFSAVSAVGIIFECAVFCYVGSMARSVTAIISGEYSGTSSLSWILLGVSACMCAIGAVFVSYTVKNAIARAEDAAVAQGTLDPSDRSTLPGGTTSIVYGARYEHPPEYLRSPPVSAFEMKTVSRGPPGYTRVESLDVRSEPPVGFSDRLTSSSAGDLEASC